MEEGEEMREEERREEEEGVSAKGVVGRPEVKQTSCEEEGVAEGCETV
jgi:hypothetical protein